MASDSPTRLGVNVRFIGDGQSIYENGDNGMTGLAYGTPQSAGIDLRACFAEVEVTIAAGDRLAIPAGIAIEPSRSDIAGFIYSRSGLGTKKGLTVSQGVGVIDPDYRGEIIVSLLNTSKEDRTITRGERIAQLVFQPFFQAEISVVEELGATQRGAGGFGHTGSM